MIFDLPDLGKTPPYYLFAAEAAPAATAVTVAFNTTLEGRVDAMRDGGINVIDVDLFAFRRYVR